MTEANPLDFVPDEIPFDTSYGPPVSLDRTQAIIHAAVAEAKKRNWKMKIGSDTTWGKSRAASVREACTI